MKNMIILKNEYSPEDFYEKKNDIDVLLYHDFEQKFKKMLNFYKSLSTLNAYRKVQKISIIKTPQTDDTILNLLNKITDTNYDRISQKVLLKLKDNNLINFTNQIFKYSEKSNNNNSLLLWKLINYLYQEYILLYEDKAIEVNEQINKIIEEYITDFINEFNVNLLFNSEYKNLTNEQYNEFVNRNMNNSTLFAKMKMICNITEDKTTSFKINWRLLDVYNTLIKELQVSIDFGVEFKDKFENINNNILECLLIIISSKILYSESFCTQSLRELEDIKLKNQLSNKNKFKLLDIIDITLADLKKLKK